MSDSSSSEEEDVPQFTKNATQDFFKTLTALKNNDPSIYKKDSKFYHDDDEKPVATKSREKSMTLKDYDRAKIIEKGGIIDEATEDMKFASGIKNYHQEQADLKEEIRKAGAEIDLSDSDSDDGLFTKKPSEVKIENDEPEVEAKPVNSKEKFIFDYIINQKWNADDNEEDYSSGEELSDKKYRKDDADFIRPLVEKEEAVKSEPIDPLAALGTQKSHDPKSYPRGPEIVSMRQDAKAEKRAAKRAEKKAKRELKLAQKKEETARKKNEKVERLKTQLDKLREAVGNEIELDENMFDGDFDPAAHDKIMEKLAEHDFGDDEKPVFDEMDFTGFDFSDDELQKKSKKERKRGKRAKKGELEDDRIDEAKTHFPDAVKEIEALEYEVDYVGDEELKFKYRETDAQDYGLTIEEMLNATDQELNTWISLKQVTKYQRQDEINGDNAHWQRQANNMKRKKQVFKSIYGTEEEKERIAENQANKKAKKMNSKRRRKLRERLAAAAAAEAENDENGEKIENESVKEDEKKLSKKAKKRKNKQNKTVVNEDRLEQYFGADTKQVVKKMKYGDTSLKHEV